MSSDEKDRLGDTLHNKKKAEEDRYFAERERELLAKKRAAEASGTAPAATCPRCGSALASVKRAGVPVEVCNAGHGLWLDQGELETIAKREKDSWLSRLLGE